MDLTTSRTCGSYARVVTGQWEGNKVPHLHSSAPRAQGWVAQPLQSLCLAALPGWVGVPEAESSWLLGHRAMGGMAMGISPRQSSTLNVLAVAALGRSLRIHRCLDPVLYCAGPYLQ